MDSPPGSSNERRHLPRHIRDGEHEPWNETGEFAVPATNAVRGRRLLVYVAVVCLVIAALVLGLWIFNGSG